LLVVVTGFFIFVQVRGVLMLRYSCHCEECGADFEKSLNFSEINQNVECPKCSSRKTRKALSLFANSSFFSNTPAKPEDDSCSSGGFA